MKTKFATAKRFVHNHKEAVVVSCITIPVIVTQAKGITRLNNFLKEKDLFNEYYFNNEI